MILLSILYSFYAENSFQEMSICSWTSIKPSCPWGIVPSSLLIKLLSLTPLAKLYHFICINMSSHSGFLENKEGILCIVLPSVCLINLLTLCILFWWIHLMVPFPLLSTLYHIILIYFLNNLKWSFQLVGLSFKVGFSIVLPGSSNFALFCLWYLIIIPTNLFSTETERE